MDLVLYPRVSTRKQAKKELSIPEQIREMRAYCAQHGHSEVKIYPEKGASARDDKRPVFRQMIEDLLSGAVKVQGILVYDRSRFFRDLFQAKYYEEKLKKKGIQVLSVTLPTENLDAPFANAFKNFQDTVNQLQSDMNALYTLGGMKANARKGFFNGGTPPYGYRVQKLQDEKGNIKSKLEICQEEEGVVQTIFSLYAQGRGAKKVAILLNEEGFRTRQGRKWTKDRVLAILSNSVYKGEYIFNCRDSKTGQEKPEKERIRVRVDPIVDEEIFDLAQEIRKQNAPEVTNPAVSSSPTLLTPLLKCGLCGDSMTLETAKSGRYRYYNCQNFLRRKSCPGLRIPMKMLDKEALEHLTERLFSLRRLALLVREFAKDMRGQAKRTKGQEVAIHSAIRDNERKLENIYSLIEQGRVSKSNLDERIAQRRNKIRLLQTKLYQLREQRSFSLPPHVFSASFLEKFRSKLRKALYSDPRLAKTYLKFFLTKILVRGRNVTLVGKKDILTHAIIANDQENLAAVPTAGGTWLPGLDSNRHVDEVGLIPEIMASDKSSTFSDKKTPHWSVDLYSQILAHVGSILIIHRDFIKGILNTFRQFRQNPGLESFDII